MFVNRPGSQDVVWSTAGRGAIAVTGAEAGARSQALQELTARIGQCRICRDQPLGAPLPHAPRPVLRVSASARLLLAGQAPGARVHASGVPFDDRSGDRLRQWLGVTREVFYDVARINIAPMGFCFPGYDAKGSDLPPRRECRLAWHDDLFALATQYETIVLIGRHAQAYHYPRLGRAYAAATPLADLVRASVADAARYPRVLCLPHPSWRNTGWLKANPWFERESLPQLRAEVERLAGGKVAGAAAI